MRKRKLQSVVAGAVAASLMVTAGVRAAAQGVPAVQADYSWRLEGLDGKPRALSESRGRVVFINLWATWCSPCIAELASIQRLHDSLAGSGVDFLIVSPEERRTVQRFIRRRRHTFPVFLEAEPIPETFDLRALPTTYILDRRGRIVLKHRGAADWNTDTVRAMLRRLATEQ